MNDGDKSLVLADNKLIEIAERNMQGIVPLYYNMRKADPTILTNSAVYSGLNAAFTGGNIGAISNDITKIWNNEVFRTGTAEERQEALSIIKLLCMENNYIIDYAKTLYKPTRPDIIGERIKKFTQAKTPHFFIYAKDKEKTNVEQKNNSVVNQLETIIVDKRIKYPVLEFGKFDYTMLMSDRCSDKIDTELIDVYKKENLTYQFKLSINDSGITNLSYISKLVKAMLGEFNYTATEVADMLVFYLYSTNNRHKQLLWFTYGDIILENLKHNIDKKVRICLKCGSRFEPASNNQKYCIMCGNDYHAIGHKKINCSDCGSELTIDAKDNKTKRCKDCQQLHRRDYDKLRKRKKNPLNSFVLGNPATLDFTGL